MLRKTSEILNQAISDSLSKISPDTIDTSELSQPEPKFGDFSTNIALILARQVKDKNPRQLAAEIISHLEANAKLMAIVDKIEIAGPGFINFTIKPALYVGELSRILNEGDSYGRTKDGRGKKVVIDYSSPNIAKRFSVGHLRSTIIGQALYNTFEFHNWKAIGDNHLGDWGTQFGQMIVAIEMWATKPVEQLSIAELEELYIRFNTEAKQDKTLVDRARQAFANLENGSAKEKQMWKKLVETSMTEFADIYKLLNVDIDYAYGESAYEDLMKTVIAEAKKKGIVTESDGAMMVHYPGDALPPAMLQKSDGSTTYFTRDLATIRFRKEKWRPDKIVYEVGVEQSLHFQQLFWAAEMMGYATREQLVHVKHGLIRLPEGKMSTRAGRTVKLDDVLREAITKAAELTSEKSLAQQIGVGAVKYNDLKNSPNVGYTFRWEDMLNFQGNSGPYLQYTHARAKTVASKAKGYSVPDNYEANEREMAVLRKLAQFEMVTLKVIADMAPNVLCAYLFSLAQAFNTFYNVDSVLNAKEQAQQEFRVALSMAVAQVMSSGLNLLGIESPDKV